MQHNIAPAFYLKLTLPVNTSLDDLTRRCKLIPGIKTRKGELLTLSLILNVRCTVESYM